MTILLFVESRIVKSIFVNHSICGVFRFRENSFVQLRLNMQDMMILLLLLRLELREMKRIIDIRLLIWNSYLMLGKVIIYLGNLI